MGVDMSSVFFPGDGAYHHHKAPAPVKFGGEIAEYDPNRAATVSHLLEFHIYITHIITVDKCPSNHVRNLKSQKADAKEPLPHFRYVRQQTPFENSCQPLYGTRTMACYNDLVHAETTCKSVRPASLSVYAFQKQKGSNVVSN